MKRRNCVSELRNAKVLAKSKKQTYHSKTKVKTLKYKTDLVSITLVDF